MDTFYSDQKKLEDHQHRFSAFFVVAVFLRFCRCLPVAAIRVLLKSPRVSRFADLHAP